MQLFLKAVLTAAVLAAVVFGYQRVYHNPSDPSATGQANASDDAIATTASIEDANAFELESKPFELAETETQITSGTATESTPSVDNTPAVEYPPLNAYDIAQAPVDDATVESLVFRLRNDKQLLIDLINEYRAETDPKRLNRLTMILGLTATQETLTLAEEMIYSGIDESRDAGLGLLSRIAPNNPAAFDVAANLLSSETQPDVLVATMNVLAIPKNADDNQLALFEAQISQMVNHESVAVRRQSISILSRISNDSNLDPILVNALDDNDASVREAAAFAYAEFPYENPQAIDRLMRIVEDQNESKGLRRGAAYALKNKGLDDASLARVNAALQQMSRRSVSQ
jgi:uncharacterized protein (UPF0147 family)